MKLHQAKYTEMLLRPEWKQKRQEILARDGSACRNCGTREKLQVHHRQYHRCQRTGHKLAPWCYDQRLLVTLCDSCHQQGHSMYRVPRITI